MDRFSELKNIFENCRYFKVVCGAGNEDPEEVRKLTFVYTLAGAYGIDVSANVGVVKSAVRGIEQALSVADELEISIAHRPFINVSVGLKGDPHVRKARIDADLCTQCGECFDACEQGAIDDAFQVLKQRCIGCGACAEVCPVDAVGFYTRKVDFESILPACLEAGAENIELHAVIADDEAVLKDWRTICSFVHENYISMCLDRSALSNEHLIDRIRQVKEIAGERLIIQADGAPMSGGTDSFNTTLQAIAIADIVQKSGIPLMLLASGGTNSKTGEMAKLCGVKVNGVSIGTFARKLVREQVSLPDFESNMDAIMTAYRKAKWLVDVNMNKLVKD